MKTLNYGTVEWAMNELAIAELNYSIIKDTISNRLDDGEIKAVDLANYANVMEKAEYSLEYAKNCLKTVQEKEGIDNE